MDDQEALVASTAVLMKLLESAPWRYDQGLKVLTLGVDAILKQWIADKIVGSSDHVLDIGSGTGTLARLCARKGAQVIGIDVSPAMIALAQAKAVQEKLDDRVQFREMDLTETDQFPDASFDVVTATLVLSELSDVEQAYLLREARRLLRPDGRLIIVDEVRPRSIRKMLPYYVLRVPLTVFTFILSQTTTHRVKNLEEKLRKFGFQFLVQKRYLLDSLLLLIVTKPHQEQLPPESQSSYPTVQVGSRLKYVAETIFRWVAVATSPGLLPVGQPSPQSPVLVTCNYDLTIRRVLKTLQQAKIDCYVLVAPTRGINVWCAACGGDFTAHSVIAAIKLSGINNLVRHRGLILPQLAAPGVDPDVIKQETGWTAQFGPVYAADIPAYLKNEAKKTECMRTVRFPVSRRLEMASLYAIMISLCAVPLSLIFAPTRLLLTLGIIWLLTYGAYLLIPYLPSRSGFVKTLVYGICAISGVLLVALYTTGSLLGLLWELLVTISVVIILGVDLNGMTPILPSDLGQLLYKRGHSQMPFFTGRYPLQPYGQIAQDAEQCNGCGVCVQVCPMNIFQLDTARHKANPAHSQRCINCNACVHRCPQHCLQICTS
ncbi:MAG: HgcAB-like fusion protein [Promethearchaeota archaeon]